MVIGINEYSERLGGLWTMLSAVHLFLELGIDQNVEFLVNICYSVLVSVM